MVKLDDYIQKSKNNSSENLLTVNFISFSGHGLTYDGDSIGVIPQKKNDVMTTRFINFSGIARKFASINNTLNIFILSMCRVLVGH